MSSRLGRDLERWHRWFETLRQTIQTLAPTHRAVVTCQGATADLYVRHACSRLECRMEIIQWPPAQQPFSQWLDSLECTLQQEGVDRSQSLWISPPLQLHANSRRQSGERDVWLYLLADEIVLLYRRPNGNLDRLLTQIHHEPEPTGPLESPRQHDGRRWYDMTRVCQPTETIDDGATHPASTESHRLRPNRPRSYLTHWTRERHGPWPGQSETDYLDELVFADHRVEHSAFATLTRIVTMRRLLASGRLIRGGTPAVSFTALPVEVLAERRTFRPHLGRWDAQPYGICVDLGWLVAQGTRPVVYGDEQTWRRLSEQDRPFFQQATTRSRSQSRSIVWREEYEWRHPGDVDLSELSASQAFVFVPNADLARKLQPISPWPVVVVG